MRRDARDWTEDYPHENGKYLNNCIHCNQTFYGHKRRMVCRVCGYPMVVRDKMVSVPTYIFDELLQSFRDEQANLEDARRHADQQEDIHAPARRRLLADLVRARLRHEPAPDGAKYPVFCQPPFTEGTLPDTVGNA